MESATRTTRDGADIAVAFSRVLRGAGVRVPTSATASFAEALGAVGLTERDHVYWAGRATLVRRPEDTEPYNRAFAVFFDQRNGSEIIEPFDEPLSFTLVMDTDDDNNDDDNNDGVGEPSTDPIIELRFSEAEVLRNKDFATYSHEELSDARQLMSQLRLVGEPRRSLRLTRAARRTPRPDLGRTIKAALRTDNEPIERAYRRPSTKLRRLVLLLDVSGSMEPYARGLIRFVQAAVAGRQKVEAFALGTRLTRITRELDSHDPDLALARAAEQMVDYGGGTRLGEGLRTFNNDWGQRGMARGAIVVILSDGWDRGDPELLGEQMERLHRVAHRVVWVNPLKFTPGYAPLARGMMAALPHVDDFVEGHSIAALDQLAAIIAGRAGRSSGRPQRREHGREHGREHEGEAS